MMPSSSGRVGEGPVTAHHRVGPRGGFTLVELLVVIAIIVLLAALIVPAVRGPVEGVQLNSAADSTSALLAQARQAAITRSVPVEVRIYQVDDGTGLAWRMMGTVVPGTALPPTPAGAVAADEWISPPTTLAGSVLLVNDGTTQYSTVLTTGVQQSSPSVPCKKTEPATAIYAVRNKDYVSFAFEPNGSTNLPEGSPWTLTLRGLHGVPQTATPALNYFALVIDPRTGRTLTYQP